MIWFNLGLIVMLFFYVHRNRTHIKLHCHNIEALKNMSQANHTLILLMESRYNGTVPEEILKQFLEDIGATQEDIVQMQKELRA